MSISFEKKVAPLESQCCFPAFSSNPQLIPATSPRVFKNTNLQNKNLLSESDLQIKERKEGIQSMKKSISSINLKRKYSDGFPTNRVSINQSQFVPRHQKRFITHSMDTEVLKGYLPHYQSLSSLNSGSMTNLQNQEKRTQYFVNSNETLESLAEKFKKNRDIKIQNYVEQTKKNIQSHSPLITMTETQNLQKKFARQVFKSPNFPHYENKIPQNVATNSRLEFRSPQRQIYVAKTVEQTASTKLVHQDQITENQVKQRQKYPLDIEMSQVDSMIIEIKTVKNPSFIDKRAFFKKDKVYLGANTEITESRHFQGSKIAKIKKRSIAAQRQLANYETMTVNSDYEEDEGERVEKIEESAIMMNFFNPPSFIKEKLALSVARNA